MHSLDTTTVHVIGPESGYASSVNSNPLMVFGDVVNPLTTEKELTRVHRIPTNRRYNRVLVEMGFELHPD